ncbi:Tetratricopeptide-like helical [Penicillium cf. griseofulvum]|uniref:Serine/threonine-protein kinase ATG1 n=1 Tax=Penicillium cf. griseofulvum TaxID=2972120 RepID=A0A9W9IXN8_9EURO|nr:Tetratricopeptide-like helical [Penicillium cf. griseofulvum]KAJ5429066.1 Tetratricopeptide-like helical [Penicillium cf. griseofulvum]KAJ5437139.1 Tetratricopeptide-like helical [Penicillium cf. griseofulvum]
MARISDLIRDSKLETIFLPDTGVETVHKFQESDPTSGLRLMTRSEHWQRQKRIGGGGFGSVWLEKCTKGGRPGNTAQDGAVRAVKQIDTDTRLGSISQLFIAMEYLEVGDLFVYLYKRPPLPEPEVKEIAYQILDGLSMMHENGFAHRDLKPNNILIKSHPPDKWWIKLADFGITKRIEESHGTSTTVKGTPRYFAPEVWGFVERGSAYAADIWALGEIVFEIFTKKPAFTTPGSLASYKAQQDFPVTMLTDAGISQPGVGFVRSLMCPNPNDRMTATSAMSSAWIQSLVLQPPESTEVTESNPLIPSPVIIMIEEFASWTIKLSLEALEDALHGMSSSTIIVDMVNAAQGKTVKAQKGKVHSSPRTAVPVVVQVQGPIETLELRRTGLQSQHQTGVSLYRQKQYKEAEATLRRALQGREKVLGNEHQETLRSAHWLGLSLCRQKWYKEAEIMSRRALEGREKVLGHNHEETLRTAQWLGHSLYHRGQYKEAEEIFRQTLQGRKEVLGEASTHTLYSTHYLGLSLFRQKRYNEAEDMFRQALHGRRKTLGHDHEETINGKCQSRWSKYLASPISSLNPCISASLRRPLTLTFGQSHLRYS